MQTTTASQRSKRFRTISFSSELVEREVNKLQRALRQLYFKLKRGQITWEVCVEDGSNTIYIAYQGMLFKLEDFLRKHQLQLDIDDIAFTAVLSAALLNWRNIAADTAGLTLDTPVQPLLINGRVVEIFSGKPPLEYWLSQRGLLQRVDLLGQDFEYSIANEAMKTAASDNVSLFDVEEAGGVYGLKWIDEKDDRECEDCISSGLGGEAELGLYLPHEFDLLELPPLHPNCRCRIAIVLLLTS